MTINELAEFIYGGNGMLGDTQEIGLLLFQIARGMNGHFGGINALEIGVRYGGTTVPLLCGLYSVEPPGKLVSIDNDGDIAEAHKVALMRVRALELPWEFYLADSRTWESPYPSYHLIYIDADHSYNGVKGDFEKYSQLLAPGGIMLFHDAESYQGVSKALEEKRGDWDITTLPFSHGLAIARRKGEA